MFDWIKKVGAVPKAVPNGTTEFTVEARVRIMAHTEVEASRKVGALLYWEQRVNDPEMLGFRITAVTDCRGITHTSPKDYPTHPGSFLLAPNAEMLTMREAYGSGWRNRLRYCIAQRQARVMDARPWARLARTIEFTTDTLTRFTRTYETAVHEGQDGFTFDGQEYATAFAKYLLEYLALETYDGAPPDLDSHLTWQERAEVVILGIGSIAADNGLAALAAFLKSCRWAHHKMRKLCRWDQGVTPALLAAWPLHQEPVVEPNGLTVLGIVLGFFIIIWVIVLVFLAHTVDDGED